MTPEEMVGKRVFLHGGYATVVGVRRSNGNGREVAPLAVLRYDGFSAQSTVKPSEIERLPDERGRKL